MFHKLLKIDRGLNLVRVPMRRKWTIVASFKEILGVPHKTIGSTVCLNFENSWVWSKLYQLSSILHDRENYRYTNSDMLQVFNDRKQLIFTNFGKFDDSKGVHPPQRPWIWDFCGESPIVLLRRKIWGWPLMRAFAA